MKTFFTLALVSVASLATVEAADVEKLELKCIDRQELSKDNVYVRFYVDGKEMKFKVTDHAGLTKTRNKSMTDGSVLIFPKDTRNRLRFKKELRVQVLEIDINGEQMLGDVKIGVKQKDDEDLTGTHNGRSHEYKLTWQTSA